MGQGRGHNEDKMADKKVIVWGKVRGRLREKIVENMVIAWAKPGA